MEEDISIIDTNTRIEKIKNFFIKNKKYLITILSLIIIIIFAFFVYNEIQNKKITIYNKDVLKFNFEKKLQKDTIIFGNLPYNIASQILVNIIKFKKLKKSL